MIEYVITEGTARIGQLRHKIQDGVMYSFIVSELEVVEEGIRVKGRILSRKSHA